MDTNLMQKKDMLSISNAELSEQSAIMAAIQSVGLPALNDYHQWLIHNGFDANMPNPTNSFAVNFMERKLCGKQIYRKVLL